MNNLVEMAVFGTYQLTRDGYYRYRCLFADRLVIVPARTP
jgi:hypothetical protein